MKALTDYRAWLSPRQVRFWLVIAAIAWTLGGFLLLPWLLQRELPQLARDYLERDATVRELRFNPWTLALEADGLQVFDTDGSEFAGIEHLRVDLQLSSAFLRALVFSEVIVREPRLRIVRDESGVSNIGRLVSDLETPPAPDASPADGEPLRLVVELLNISEGAVELQDRLPTTPFDTSLAPINIEVERLSTLPNDAGEQEIRVSTEGSGSVEWTGSLQLNPLNSAGCIVVDVPALALLARYLGDQLNFDLSGGHVQLNAGYTLAAGADGLFRLAVNDLGLAVDETSLTTEEDGEALLDFDGLRVTGGELRWPEQSASVEQVELDGANVELWLNEDGSLNISRLIAAAAPDAAAGTAPAAENEVPPEGQSQVNGETSPDATLAPDWDLRAAKVRIAGLSAAFQDRTLPDQPRVAIDDLNLTLSDLGNAPGASFPFELQAAIASGGSLAAQGDVGILPEVVADAGLALDAVQLAVAQPWLSEQVRVLLGSGTLSADARLRSSPDETLDLRGQLQVDDLLLTGTEQQELVGWQQLAVEQLIFELDGRQLEIGRLRLRQPAARVAIREDRSTNFSNLVIDDAGGDEAGAEDAPFVFRMGQSSIEDGRVDFSDESLPLPFRTDIREFGGSVSAMATDTREPSKLDFAGRVGKFGEARVTGELLALDPLRNTDVRVEFRNLALPDLSPYSVDFAGRKLAAGKLNLDLKYRLEESRLAGNNKIVIDKIKLGEKVDNPDALDLPLDLAVALLTDSRGVIDMQLRVEGDVGDPEFSARGVIAKALGNLLIKIVSSPFRLLGTLVGGGDNGKDLQNIDFEAGKSTLSPPEEEKLSQLGDALAQRPVLKLTVAGVYAPGADKPAIQMARIQAAAEAELEGQDDGDALRADRAREAFENLARERLPDLSLADLQAAYTTRDEDPGTPDFDMLAYLTELRQRLADTEPVSEADLAALGAARADAVVEYLQTAGGLAADRIETRDPTATDQVKNNEVELALVLDAA